MRQTGDDFLKAKKLIVEQKYKKGITSLRNCASRGHGGCAQLLGAAYYAGRWVGFDIDAAIKWLFRAYQTSISFEFAGVYSAINLATIMCDPRNHQGGYKRHLDWIKRAKVLFELLATNRERMHSKTEKVFSALSKKIILLENSANAESCKVSYQ